MRDNDKSKEELIEELQAERRRSAALEEAVGKSEEQYRLMVLNSPDLVILQDLEGVATYVSPQAEEVVGRSTESLVGRGLPAIIHPDDKTSVREAYAAALQGKELIRFEYRVLDENGGVRWLSHTARPLFARGEQVGIQSNVRNISSEKIIEEALRGSEQRYQSLYNTMTEGVALHELLYDDQGNPSDYRILDVNPSYAEQTGLSLENVIGQTAGKFYGTGESPYLSEYASVVKTGEPLSFETYFPPIDRHFRISVFSPAKDKFATVFTDITKLKRAEEAVRLYSDSVENMQIGLHVYKLEDVEADSTLRLIATNPAAEAAIGVAMEDVLGKTLDENFPGLRKLGIPQAYAEVVRTGESKTLEDVYYTDERVAPANYSIRVFPLPNSCVGVAFENITNQRRAEAERHELEEKLQQAHKMEALGTLAGGVAHDFNNLLQGILGNADLAMMDVKEGSDSHFCLQQVVTGSQRAAELVEQILAFSRKSSDSPTTIRLQAVLAEALKLIRPALSSTIEIRLEVDDATGPVLGSAVQMHQVIMNLVSNAAHAMGQRRGVLSLNLSEVDVSEPPLSAPELVPGRYARLVVSDSGCGMDQQTLDRVFEPYFTTKGKGEGTGLGLATIHGIIKSHEGAISAESERGQGSTFTIYLPLAKTTKLAVGVGKTVDDQDAGSERILFVDDDESISAMAKMGLERLGYVVEVFTSSTEALEAYSSFPERADIIITDQTMPDLSGSELATRILERFPDCPIVLCTGFSEVINEEQARELGIREYVKKPIIIRELAKAVRAALASERENRERFAG